MVSKHCSEAVNLARNLVRDDKVTVIDNSYFEYAIHGLFSIDLHNFIYIKAMLAKNFHIQPSELERMPGWEYEMFMIELNKAIKEENKKNKEEESKYNLKDVQKMSDRRNIDRMTNDTYHNIPKMADIGKMGTPKMPSLPSFPSMKDL